MGYSSIATSLATQSDYLSTGVEHYRRADAYLKRGNVYIKLGNSQVALADYQKAARLFSEQGNVAGYLKVNNLMTVHSLQTRG